MENINRKKLTLLIVATLAFAPELKWVAEAMEAEANGELSIEQASVVINIPFVVWDGGQR